MSKPRLRAKMDRPAAVAASLAMQKVQAFSNAGASNYRNMVDWSPSRGSPDTDLLGEQGDLVARSRDLVRNSGIARGGIQTIVDNVVGTGLRLTPRPNYRALGWSKEQADEWSQQVYAEWLGWADTTACDAADSEIFDSLTAQVFRAWLMNGEALALPMWIPGRGDAWSTKVMTVEADRLSNPDFRQDDDTLRAGIKFDRFGAPVGYYIRTTHPGDWLYGSKSLGLGKWEYVPRRGPFGRMRVLHMFDRDRSGQSRGAPLISSILREFKQIDRYIGAEIDAAQMNSMIAGIITTPMDQQNIEELFGTSESAKWYMQERDKRAVKLAAGSLVALMPGDKLEPFMPARPATAFAAFLEILMRVMAAGLDLPYELLLKDFSKTNYSSARAAMLEAWRSFMRRRDALATKWCDPVYTLWLEEAVNSGRIEAEDFYLNRAALTRCRWIGPGRGWVDPVKEADASGKRMEFQLSTQEHECAELMGMDWREVAEQRATERDFLQKLGFTERDAIAPAGSQEPADDDDERRTPEPVEAVG